MKRKRNCDAFYPTPSSDSFKDYTFNDGIPSNIVLLLNMYKKHKVDFSLIKSLQSKTIMKERQKVIEYLFAMNSISSNLDFHHEVVHIAIFFMDRLLMKRILRFRKQVYFIGSACFLIAAKVEESEEPSIELIIDAHEKLFNDGSVGIALITKDIKRYEKMVLMELNWNVTISPTPHAFLYDIILLFRIEDEQIRETILLGCNAFMDGVVYASNKEWNYAFPPLTIALASIFRACTVSSTNIITDKEVTVLGKSFGVNENQILQCVAMYK